MANIIIKPLAPGTAKIITVKAVEAVVPIIRLEYSAGLPGGGGGGGVPILAANVEYDGSASGLLSTNVQGAINEVVSRLNTHTHSLASLSDVSISGTPSIGYALTWNGTVWVPSRVSGGGGGGYLADLGDVDISDPQVGDALVYDGTKWVSQNYEKLKYLTVSASRPGGLFYYLPEENAYGTVINNFGQTDDLFFNLGYAKEGMSVMFALGQTVDKIYKIRASSRIFIDERYLPYSCGLYLSSVKAGNAISFMAFYTELEGIYGYQWLAVPISGDWEIEET